MEYNKTQFSKTSDKKVLHKVRKHWVVLSTALLMALGGGAALTGGTTSANADANANSNNNNTNASSTNTLKSRLNASLTKGYQANQANNTPKSVNVNQVSSKALTNQASALHNRILANATNASQNRQSTTNGRQASQNNGNNNEGAVLNNRIKASVNAPQVGGRYNAPNLGNPAPKYSAKAPITVAYLNSDNTLQMRSDNGVLDPRVEEKTVNLTGNSDNKTLSSGISNIINLSNTNNNGHYSIYNPNDYKLVNGSTNYNFSFTSDDTDPYHWIQGSAKSDTNEAYQYIKTGSDQTNSDLIVNGKNQVVPNDKSTKHATYKVLQSINSEGQPVTVDRTNSNGQTMYYKNVGGTVKSDVNQIDNSWQPMPELATSGIGYADNTHNSDKIDPSFTWDKIENRPLILLKANNHTGHDIILNYVNQSGHALNNQWGTQSPSDTIYGGENDSGKNVHIHNARQNIDITYNTNQPNRYGDTIDTLKAVSDNLKSTQKSDIHNDYYFSTSDQKNVKKLYQFSDTDKDVTVPLTGRSFDANVANDTTQGHANEQGKNKFTIHVNLEDHKGNNAGKLTISKYLGGRIGDTLRVTPGDVLNWIHEYNKPTSSDTNIHNHHDNIGIHISDNGNNNLTNDTGKLEATLKQYSINPAYNNDDSLYVKGNGKGQGLFNSNINPDNDNDMTYEFDANAKDTKNLNGVTVHYIDQNNNQIYSYSIGKNTYTTKSDKTPLLGDSNFAGQSFLYGSAINLANINTTTNGESQQDSQAGKDYAYAKSDASVPQNYSLDPGQSTLYNLNSDSGDVYLYVNGNSVKPQGPGSYNNGNGLKINRVETFYKSNGKDRLTNQYIDLSKNNELVNGNPNNGDRIAKTNANGQITVTTPASYNNAGMVGEVTNLMADDYTPQFDITGSDAVDPDTNATDWVNAGVTRMNSDTKSDQKDMSDVPLKFGQSGYTTNDGAKNYNYNPVTKSDSVTFVYKVTTSTENAANYPVYFHYVTPSDQYDDIVTKYSDHGTQMSHTKDTTISDRGPITSDFSKDYASAIKNAPYGYQYVTTLGDDGHMSNASDNTINNHFSSLPGNGSQMMNDLNAINAAKAAGNGATSQQKTDASNAKKDLMYKSNNGKGLNVVIEVAPIVHGAQIVYVDQNANRTFSDGRGNTLHGKALNLTTNPTYIHGFDQNGVTRYGEQINLNNGSLVSNDHKDIDGKNDGANVDPEIANAHVPAGYHITQESGDVITLNQPGSKDYTPRYYVMVAGDTDNPESSKDQAKIYIHEMDPKGTKVLHTYSTTDDISGNNGDDFTVYASNFTPDGYSVDPHTNIYPNYVNGTITPNGISPRTMDFYYTKNVDMNAADLQDINVIFSDNGHEVGTNEIAPYQSDYDGKQINVLDPEWANPESNNNNDGKTALRSGNHYGYLLPTPIDGGQYKLVPGQNTTINFSDSRPNFLTLKVYNTKDQVAANFTVFKHLEASDGQGGYKDLSKVLSQNVPEHGYKKDDTPSYDHNNDFSILASDFNNVDGYYEAHSDTNHYNQGTGYGQLSDGTGQFTDYGLKPANTSFKYIASHSKDDWGPNGPSHNGKGTKPAQDPSDNSDNNVVPSDSDLPYNPWVPINPRQPIGPNNRKPQNPNSPVNPAKPGSKPKASPKNSSDNPGGHNVGPNEHVAMPIYVQFWTNDGGTMAKMGSDQRIDGYMGQHISDITGPGYAKIPDSAQYHLLNNQNLSYTISGSEQQVNLDLAKTGKYDDTVKVQLYKEDPSGKVLDKNGNAARSDKNTNVTEPVGTKTYYVSDNTSDTISPNFYHLSDFVPDNTKDNGGKGDTVSDRNGALYINGSQQTGSSHFNGLNNATNTGTINYYYKAKTNSSDANLANINVTYINSDDGRVLATKTFPASHQTSFKGESVDVASNDNLPSEIQGKGYTVNHTLTPNTVYYYGDEPQNVDVFLQAKAFKPGKFTMVRTLINSDGKSDTTTDTDYANKLESRFGDKELGQSDIITTSDVQNDYSIPSNYHALNVASDADNAPQDIKFSHSDGNNDDTATLSPSDAHFTYIAQGAGINNSDAGSLLVHYKTASGNEVATDLLPGAGELNKVIKVNTNSDHPSQGLPNGNTLLNGSLNSYTISPNQNLNYKFTKKHLDNMTVLVQGTATNANLTVKRIEVNADGTTKISNLPGGYEIKGHHVGSDVTVTASDDSFIPNGYIPSPNDEPETVHLGAGTSNDPAVNPDTVTFIYNQIQTSNAMPMVVRYWNEKGQYVGGGTLNGYGRFGKAVDVTDPDPTSNNGISGIAIPEGYHLAADGPNSNPDQRTHYTFDSESRVINLNVEGLNDTPGHVPSDIIDNTSDNTVTVHLHENQGGKDFVVHVKDLKPVGDYQTYGPNEFARYVDGYHATLSDQDTNVYTKFDTNDHVKVTWSNAKKDHNGVVMQHDKAGHVLYFADQSDGKGNLSDKPWDAKAAKADGSAPDATYKYTHEEYTKGRIFADPHDIYFNYDQNDKKAAPLKLIYLDQKGNQVGNTDVITGNLDQRVNVADPSDGGEAIPDGYTLDGGFANKTAGQPATNDLSDAEADNDITDGKGQKDASIKNAKVGANQRLNYGLTNNAKTVYLHVDGIPLSQHKNGIKQMTINLIEHNADGSVNVKTTYYDPDYMMNSGKADAKYNANGKPSDNNMEDGDTFEVTPSDALDAYDAQHMKADGTTPQSDATKFHAAASDVDQFGWINNEGSIMPSQMTFNYYAGGKTNNSDGIAEIHYYNSKTLAPVGTVQTKEGSLGSNIFGNKVTNGIMNNSDFLNMPMGYHADQHETPSMLNQKFTNSPQDIFVPVTGNTVSGNHTVTVYSIEKDNGTIKGTEVHTVGIGNSIGQSDTIDAYQSGSDTHGHNTSFIPNGYHVDPSDTGVNFSIDVNGNLEPSNSVTFAYTKNASVPKIGGVTVHYFTGNNTSNEVDEVTDHGNDQSDFNLTPYEDDVPSEIGNEYMTTGNVYNGDLSHKLTGQIKYAYGQNKNIYIQVQSLNGVKGNYPKTPSDDQVGPASRS